jgi:hypothetical protein
MSPSTFQGMDMTKLKTLALALGAALSLSALPSAQAHDLRHPGFSNGGHRSGVQARHHHHRPVHRHFHHRHDRGNHR